MVSFFSYAMAYEAPREFVPSLLVVLAGANGLAAVILTVRRKVWGPYWGLVSLVPVLLLVFTIGDFIRSVADIIPMFLLFFVPCLLILLQLKTLKRLKVLGPGWFLGSLAYGYWLYKVSSVWFKITLGLVTVLDILAALTTISLIINPDDLRSPYQIYFLINALVFGVFGLIKLFGKKMTGFYFNLGALLVVILVIVFGYDVPYLKSSNNVVIIWAFYLTSSILLLIQLPYLKKVKNLGITGYLKSTHFVDCPALSGDNLARLNRAWADFSGSWVVIGYCLALLYAYCLFHNSRGAAGNFLGVAVLFSVPIYNLIVVRKRKKRFLACLGDLNINRETFDQALRRQKDDIKNIAEPNIAEPNIAEPNVPEPNIAEPNV
jgi:hypothetical protein